MNPVHSKKGAPPLVVALAMLLGCAKPASPPAAPAATPLHVEPACDLAPAAGVTWLVDVKARAIASIPDLIPPIAQVLPEERLRLFAAAHGGVDLRQTKDLCIAQYKDSLLVVADVPLDPDRVAAAFEERSLEPTTRVALAANPRVVRITAKVADEPQRLVLFGRDALALERGPPGPLRATEAFAFEKLKRATPALKGAALQRAAEALGDAPVRAFAVGPFDGEARKGLGGLLGVSTAVGASATWVGPRTEIAVRIVLVGAWGDHGHQAAERLAAAANVLAESSVGRLFGLHQPVRSPTARAAGDTLVLEATIDGAALARGLHDALDADVADIMRK